MGNGQNVTITFTIAPTHTHGFTYSASGATITATCTAGCPDSYDTNGISLIISAPSNLVCDDSAKAATLSGYPSTAPTGLAAAPTSISYNPGGTAPTTPGTYTASFTWGGATASVSFTLTANAYAVTLSGGANATASGGETTQSVTAGQAMTTVTYTANSGYTFPAFSNSTTNGVTLTRVSDTVVTVSGTPTANVNITVPDAAAVPTFTVTVNPGPNGSAAADKTTAKAGDTITLTITPDNGYEVLAVAASDANNNQITVTNNSFTMPAANVTVTVQFKEKTTPQPVQPTQPTPQPTQPTPQPAAGKYTVTYDANNGSGEKKTQGPYDAGTTYTVEGCSFAAPAGKVFDCWQGSDGKTYKVGSPVVLNANLTLTAQWKDEEAQIPDVVAEDPRVPKGDIVFIGGFTGADEWDGYVAPQRAWKVSLAPMVNGSAALGIQSGESTTTDMNVYPTTTIYVFPNPDPGFVLDKIIWSLIDGSASYDITESRNFVMPAIDAVVYVTFKPVG